MKVTLGLALALLGCGQDLPPGGPGGSIDAPPGVTVTEVSGTIAASATWSGIIDVKASVVINAGVTITVSPGTQIVFAAADTGITLRGTLDIEGTKAMPVTIVPAVTGAHWAGVGIADNGAFTAHYMISNGGGFAVVGATASATIIDSQMSRDSHDLITVSDGSIDIEYSWIGLEPPMDDTTHCDLHLNTDSIKITHTNISTAAYGVMFYGGVGADFTHDNWFSNSFQIDALAGVQGDFSESWFDKAPTPRAGLTFNNMAGARLTDTGPR